MNISEENNNKINTSNEVYKGCGWQCMINAISYRQHKLTILVFQIA
ncbi:MAG: hypothetical protein ACTTKP_02015 [Catonella sp.]